MIKHPHGFYADICKSFSVTYWKQVKFSILQETGMCPREKSMPTTRGMFIQFGGGAPNQAGSVFHYIFGSALLENQIITWWNYLQMSETKDYWTQLVSHTASGNRALSQSQFSVIADHVFECFCRSRKELSKKIRYSHFIIY